MKAVITSGRVDKAASLFLDNALLPSFALFSSAFLRVLTIIVAKKSAEIFEAFPECSKGCPNSSN